MVDSGAAPASNPDVSREEAGRTAEGAGEAAGARKVQLPRLHGTRSEHVMRLGTDIRYAMSFPGKTAAGGSSSLHPAIRVCRGEKPASHRRLSLHALRDALRQVGEGGGQYGVRHPDQLRQEGKPESSRTIERAGEAQRAQARSEDLATERDRNGIRSVPARRAGRKAVAPAQGRGRAQRRLRRSRAGDDVAQISSAAGGARGRADLPVAPAWDSWLRRCGYLPQVRPTCRASNN